MAGCGSRVVIEFAAGVRTQGPPHPASLSTVETLRRARQAVCRQTIEDARGERRSGGRRDDVHGSTDYGDTGP